MYRELNDYELLYLISDNNDDVYGILLEKYTPMINKLSKKYSTVVKKMGYEIEDLKQICYLTLYKTLKSYNGDTNNNMFYTYLIRSIQNTMLSVIKTNTSNKKRLLNDSISYDNYISNSELTYADIFPDYSVNFYLNNNIDYAYIYTKYKNSFEFDLSCIIDLKIEGYKLKEIAILLDLKYQDVVALVKKIKNKNAVIYN